MFLTADADIETVKEWHALVQKDEGVIIKRTFYGGKRTFYGEIGTFHGGKRTFYGEKTFFVFDF